MVPCPFPRGQSRHSHFSSGSRTCRAPAGVRDADHSAIAVGFLLDLPFTRVQGHNRSLSGIEPPVLTEWTGPKKAAIAQHHIQVLNYVGLPDDQPPPQVGCRSGSLPTCQEEERRGPSTGEANSSRLAAPPPPAPSNATPPHAHPLPRRRFSPLPPPARDVRD